MVNNIIPVLLLLLITILHTTSISTSSKHITTLANKKGILLHTKKERTINNDILLNIRGGSSSSSIVVDPNSAITKATLGATTQLLSAIVLGVIATKFDGVLDQNTIKVLSRLAYNIFQPAFLLCSVVTTLSSSSNTLLSKKYLLLVTLTSFMQLFTGSLCFKCISSILPMNNTTATTTTTINTATKEDIQFCTTFANAGTLPFIIANALFKENPILLSQIVSCLSFFLLGWSPMFWTFGRYILIGNITSGDKSMMHTIIHTLFYSPPILGSFLGIIIGSIPIIRSKFITSPIFSSIQMLGYGYLPSAILVLAGSLASSSKKQKVAINDKENDDDSGSTTSKNLIQPISIILFSRFILSPIVSYQLIKLFQKLHLLPSSSKSSPSEVYSIVSFVILLQSCMPPSQNSVIVLQMYNLTNRARNMAKILTVSYIVSVVPIMILLTYCMKISNILSFL